MCVYVENWNLIVWKKIDTENLYWENCRAHFISFLRSKLFVNKINFVFFANKKKKIKILAIFYNFVYRFFNSIRILFLFHFYLFLPFFFVSNIFNIEKIICDQPTNQPSLTTLFFCNIFYLFDCKSLVFFFWYYWNYFLEGISTV